MKTAGSAGRTPGVISKADAAKEIVTAAINTLIAQLEAGESASLKAYLRTMARFHQYSFSNLMLIVSQRPDATKVAGYRAWQALGRQVIKGERGIVIMAPMVFRPTEGQASEGEDQKPVLRFRAVHVFGIAQTEGDELPQVERVRGEPGDLLPLLESGITDSGITLETVPSLGGADGVSKGGVIHLVERLSPAERFSVLVHEWAHELLHQGEAERPSKTVRETEAEAVAFVVCEYAGLETGTASSDYIRLYRGDRETLLASMGRIQKASRRIIEAVSAKEQGERQAVLERGAR